MREGVVGTLLGLFGFSISITEIVRIIYGVTNRGISNYAYANSNSVGIKHDSNLYPVSVNPVPMRVEKFHYWPWSYAANMFGLVAMFAGVAGLISSFRRSYSSLFTFMSLSLLSFLFGGYMIAYYAILLAYYLTTAASLGSTYVRSGTENTSFGLIIFNLALSSLICLFGLAGFVIGMVGIRGGTAKGLHLENKPPFIEPSAPKGKIIAVNYL